MDYISISSLNQLMRRLPKGSNLANSFNSVKEAYCLTIKNMKPELVLGLAKRINQRQKSQDKHQRLCWAFGQLKVFNCVAIYQSIATDKEIREFTDDEITKINSIFRSKSKLFIQYQIRVLANLRQTALKAWTQEELAYLSGSVDEDIKTQQSSDFEDKINWKSVSFRMFERSNGRFFHNLNHCREMWNNHLDPRVKKQQWSIDEDIQLFTLVIQLGTKWSRIAKSFNHSRTQHMVKNRYNRFFKLWKKNSDFEREESSEVIHFKFSKAHLKRLEAKKGSSGCERNLDVIKNVGVQGEQQKKLASYEAIIQQNSIQYEQISPSAGKDNKHQSSKDEQKSSQKKEEQLKKDELIKFQEQLHQKMHQPNTVYHQYHQQNIQIYPQQIPKRIEQQQQWNYYPFLRLYLSKGVHSFPQFI